MEYDSAIKKSEIQPFTMTWMDPEVIMMSKLKPDRER